MKQLLFLLVLPLFLGGCGPRTPKNAQPTADKPHADCALQSMSLNACVQVAWQKGPTDRAASTMFLKFVGLNGEAVDAPNLPSVVLWMPDMDHGSHVQPKVEKIEPGLYEVSDLVFTMNGLWEVRIHLQHDKGLEVIVFEVEL